MLAVLATVAFLTIVRTEPFTTLLLIEMKTGQLAMINASTFVGLGAGTALAIAYRVLVAPIGGRLLGELASLCAAIFVTRHSFRSSWPDFAASFVVSLVAVLAPIALLLGTSIGASSALRLAVLCCFLVVVAGVAAVGLPDLFQAGYERGRDSDASTGWSG